MCYSAMCKYENSQGGCTLPWSYLQKQNGFVQCGFIIPGQSEAEYKESIKLQDATLLKLEMIQNLCFKKY